MMSEKADFLWRYGRIIGDRTTEDGLLHFERYQLFDNIYYLVLQSDVISRQKTREGRNEENGHLFGCCVHNGWTVSHHQLGRISFGLVQ